MGAGFFVANLVDLKPFITKIFYTETHLKNKITTYRNTNAPPGIIR